MTDLPVIHPDRPGVQLRPVKAFQHFRNLMADKEDTEQVFHVTNYMRGKKYVSEAEEFLATPLAIRLRASGEYLPDVLDDHDALKKMPKGSLADAYVTFMERENLSAAGLVAEQKSFADKVLPYNDQLEWYNNRMRDTHDMFHILSGYGRDPLGELALLGFSYSQNKSLGFLFIAWLGALEERKVAPKGTPILKAIREGQRNGKLAQKIGHQDIVSLLSLPLEEVRAKLGINSPDTYKAILESYNGAGLNPHNLMEQACCA